MKLYFNSTKAEQNNNIKYNTSENIFTKDIAIIIYKRIKEKNIYKTTNPTLTKFLINIKTLKMRLILIL